MSGEVLVTRGPQPEADPVYAQRIIGTQGLENVQVPASSTEVILRVNFDPAHVRSLVEEVSIVACPKADAEAMQIPCPCIHGGAPYKGGDRDAAQIAASRGAGVLSSLLPA
jgi:hypothetical protein